MKKPHNKIYDRVFKIGFTLAVAMVMALTLTACGGDGDDRDKVKTQPTQEETVATDTTGTQANEPEAEPTDSGHHSSAKTSSGDIGEENVKAIILAKVPGATASNIIEIEREHDDGHLKYEGTLYYNGYEYEFELDGATGNILKWEIDD